jgi:hypothetical protein
MILVNGNKNYVVISKKLFNKSNKNKIYIILIYQKIDKNGFKNEI